MYSKATYLFVMIGKKIIVGLLVISSLVGYALPNVDKFEGSINLKRETIYDTTFVTIRVKKNLVRLDEYDNHKNIVSTYIINLDNENVLAFSPSKKLFYELKANRLMDHNLEDTVVIKTQNKIVLEGKSCCQMRVKCKSQDTEVAFWVTENNFDFFTAMNKILQKVKPDIDFFNYFPNVQGVFPMLIVERTLLRKEKQKVLVTAIQESHLNEALFRIPLGYQKIEQ